MEEYFEKNKHRYKPNTTFVYKTPQQLFDELPDCKFDSVIWETWNSGMVIRVKHPNMSKKEILEKLGCADEYSMAQFRQYSETEFKVSYFTD